MSNKDKSLALLPNGFVDLLPPEAQKEADSISVLMEKFSSFGYRRIKPPMVEFEDSLLAPGPGARLALETFRLMDPVTHRMLGVRSDITPQIARIVSSRLGNENRPLRLAYANDVLRIRGSQMRTERQFTQVGCELIGQKDGVDGDVEICMLALLGMKAVGITDITLDFTIPGFVSSVLEGVDDNIREDVSKAVSRRDVDALRAFSDERIDVLVQVMSVCGGAQKAISALSQVCLPVCVQTDVQHLTDVYAGVCAALDDLGIDDVALSVDMVEQDGFEYHKGLGFTLFSKLVSAELGRGGSYGVCFGAEEGAELAKGFTLYMDTISKCVSVPENEKRVLVSFDVQWSVIKSLQEQGWIVVRGEGDTGAHACKYVYKNGAVEKIS